MYTVYECSIWYAAYKDKERFWKLRPLPVDLDDWYDMAWNKLIRMGLPIPPLPPHLSMLRNEGKAVQGRIDEHVTSGRLGLSVASWMFAYFTPVVNPPPLAPWSAASRWPVRGPPGNGDLWSVGSTRETRSLEAPSFHRTCMLRRMWCHNLRFWDTENRGWDRKNKINRSTDINELRLWRDSSWNCLSHERASPPQKKREASVANFNVSIPTSLAYHKRSLMDKRQLFECFDLNRNGCAGPKISSVRISDYFGALASHWCTDDLSPAYQQQPGNQKNKKMIINFSS